MTTSPEVCAAELGAFSCTLRPGHRGDHAEQVIAPSGVMAASYTRAFWQRGSSVARIVDPYHGTR